MGDGLCAPGGGGVTLVVLRGLDPEFPKLWISAGEIYPHSGSSQPS
jgi:hypothetical protein